MVLVLLLALDHALVCATPCIMLQLRSDFIKIVLLVPLLQIAYNHYVGRRGLEMPWTRKLLERYWPEGTDFHWGTGTLTHADTAKWLWVPGVNPITCSAALLQPATPVAPQPVPVLPTLMPGVLPGVTSLGLGLGTGMGAMVVDPSMLFPAPAGSIGANARDNTIVNGANANGNIMVTGGMHGGQVVINNGNIYVTPKGMQQHQLPTGMKAQLRPGGAVAGASSTVAGSAGANSSRPSPASSNAQQQQQGPGAANVAVASALDDDEYDYENPGPGAFYPQSVKDPAALPAASSAAAATAAGAKAKAAAARAAAGVQSGLGAEVAAPAGSAGKGAAAGSADGAAVAADDDRVHLSLSLGKFQATASIPRPGWRPGGVGG